MDKKIIATTKAPQAIGPYSQAVKVSGFLFISGQISIDPQTGEFVEGGVIEQTRRVLENMKAILEAAGMSLQNVVKCSCFLSDMEDFSDFNTIYEEYFKDILPARECVEVSKLPKNALIEVSAICQ